MSKIISQSEVSKHKTSNSAWVVIHNNVYDLTEFLDEHPGGADSILEVAGKDGTQGFEDVGHSEDAREMMKKYKIGALPMNERNAVSSCGKGLKHLSGCLRLPEEEVDNKKPWRNFDGKLPRRKEKSVTPKIPYNPNIGKRVHSIIVPNERRPIPSDTGGGSKLKWALLALAGAVVVGFVLKKYMT